METERFKPEKIIEMKDSIGKTHSTGVYHFGGDRSKRTYHYEKGINGIRRNKLERLGESTLKAMPIIAGALVGIAMIAGGAYYYLNYTKPEIDKAMYKLEQKLDHEDNFNKFISDSYRH